MIVAELTEMKIYRQQKFHSLTYVVKIDSGNAYKQEAKIMTQSCNFMDWLETNDRKEHLVDFLGSTILKELTQLHQMWIDDYNKIYSHFYKDSFIAGLFSKSNKRNEQDKIEAYFNDLSQTNTRCDDKMDMITRRLKECLV